MDDPGKVIYELVAALNGCLHQISQMRGMFNDEDGTIQAAVDDADEALDMADAYLKVKPDSTNAKPV